MAHDLTDDEIDKLCSYIKVMSFVKQHQALLYVSQMMEENKKLALLVKVIMDQLMEEQQNNVLQIHNIKATTVAKNKCQRFEKKEKILF